ncbi:ATP phosphoribosyltransferase, partial [Akkermansia muciniphila]|nr:ATP phosphoribosyltransferase [Akkermansia muciniphila]
ACRGNGPACEDYDLEVFLIGAQELGGYVNDGFFDCGITGRDWIYENWADVEVLTDLQYSKATSKHTRWVLVVP